MVTKTHYHLVLVLLEAHGLLQELHVLLPLVIDAQDLVLQLPVLMNLLLQLILDAGHFHPEVLEGLVVLGVGDLLEAFLETRLFLLDGQVVALELVLLDVQLVSLEVEDVVVVLVVLLLFLQLLPTGPQFLGQFGHRVFQSLGLDDQAGQVILVVGAGQR